MSDKKILIIVPAFNESGSIERTLAEIRSAPMALDILVVNDGSADDTADRARAAGADVAALPYNLGIGGAVQTGYLFARKHGYDAAVQMDGDGQHDVRYLPAILAPVLGGQADLAVGSRFLRPFLGYRSSFVRRIGIQFFARLISVLIRCPVTDPTSGFRAAGRGVIELFADKYPHDFPEPESIVMAHRCGFRVAEVPVEMKERVAGQSSIRYFKTFYYMVKVTLAILLQMIKHRERRRDR